MSVNGPIPLPTLITLPNPKPVVAPAFRLLTRVHLNLKSFSFLISIPIPCKTPRTSCMTSRGGLEDKADWSTRPVWTRILISSVRGEPEEVVRRGTFVGVTVDVSAVGAVTAVEEGMCDFALAGSGIELREAGTSEAVEVAVIEFSMLVLFDAGPRGTRADVADPEVFCDKAGAATGMISGGGSSALTLLGVDC